MPSFAVCFTKCSSIWSLNLMVQKTACRMKLTPGGGASVVGQSSMSWGSPELQSSWSQRQKIPSSDSWRYQICSVKNSLKKLIWSFETLIIGTNKMIVYCNKRVWVPPFWHAHLCVSINLTNSLHTTITSWQDLRAYHLYWGIPIWSLARPCELMFYNLYYDHQ